MAEETVPTSVVRLLAYGDSLTAGYTKMGSEFHPYADALSSAWGVKVDHIGMSGFTTAQFLDQIDAAAVDVCDIEWPSLNDQLSKHSYVGAFILGGTNDLADFSSVDEVVGNLAEIHSHFHSKGVRTVALSIPSSAGCERSPRHNELRKSINAMLKETFGADGPGEMSMFVDADAMVPFSSETGVWDDDGLHMTAKGYATLGAGIAGLAEVNKFLVGRAEAKGSGAEPAKPK